MTKILRRLAIIAGIIALTPAAAPASPKLTVLMNFNSSDGANPYGGLIADSDGNLYGTTEIGGMPASTCAPYNVPGCGTVFKLAPPQAGQTHWTESVLMSFYNAHGVYPEGSLIADAAGHLFGSDGKTAWTESVLVSFDGLNGSAPSGALILDAAGSLYGTPQFGGTSKACSNEPGYGQGCGTVFKLKP